MAEEDAPEVGAPQTNAAARVQQTEVFPEDEPISENLNPVSLAPGQRFDPSRTREIVRGVVAALLLLVLLFVVVASFATVWVHPDTNALEDLLKVIFGPIVTLVASMMGFYYATREH